jgi:hypothetical protein
MEALPAGPWADRHRRGLLRRGVRVHLQCTLPAQEAPPARQGAADLRTAEPFLGHFGIGAIRNTPSLGNANGFIEADDGYRHKQYPVVYAAGVAVYVPPVGETAVPCGVPKTGYPSEMMAKTAAHNIAADITGGDRASMPFSMIHAYCIMDTGKMPSEGLSVSPFAPGSLSHRVAQRSDWPPYQLRRRSSLRSPLQ